MRIIRENCPACTGKGAFAFDEDGYQIFVCMACGSKFVHDVPSEDELKAIYAAEDYYELCSESIERIRQEATRRCKILSRLKKRGSFIEIGCARGLQLDVAKSHGWQTYGTDLSENNVSICREKGHQVCQGGVEAAFDLKKDGFDVVACLDVIEHVQEPLTFLKECAALMAEDGIMIVTTPNYSGVVARLLGPRDPFMTPPEHLNFFTRSGMHHLFRECDLQVVKRATFGTLTKGEVNRTLPKYFPRLASLAPLLNPLMPLGAFTLNILRCGLEMEFYLVRGED